MAHVMKFTKMQAMAVIAHQERTSETHSNANIDPERTKDNYCVWPLEDPDRVGEKHGWKRLTKRLSEVDCLQRSDVNVLVEWTIHLGVDVPPGYENEEAFFQACMNYCAKKYGAKNICYGIVHKDEETPHLTVGFVPVVEKKRKLRKNASKKLKEEYEQAVAAGKTTVERVDANSLINQKHLQGWHGDFTAYLKDELGYDPAVYTGITKDMGGNMTVDQLKAKPADWRKKRNTRAKAFHNARKAALKGRQPSIEDKMTLANPERPQATSEGNKPLFERMREAAEKSGGSRW